MARDRYIRKISSDEMKMSPPAEAISVVTPSSQRHPIRSISRPEMSCAIANVKKKALVKALNVALGNFVCSSMDGASTANEIMLNTQDIRKRTPSPQLIHDAPLGREAGWLEVLADIGELQIVNRGDC